MTTAPHGNLRRRIISSLILATLVVAAEPGMSFGHGSAPPTRGIDLGEIDEFVASAVHRFEPPPGIAVTVVLGGGLAWTKAYGLADVDQGTPATRDTGFYIASATKPFVGMAASILEEQGLLHLDDPVTKHFPSVELPTPSPEDIPSLRDFLTHTSGIRNVPLDFRPTYTGWTPPREAASALSQASEWIGNDFSYTNMGYNVVGAVMEKVTGMPWQEVLARTIFDPMGMTRTTAYMSRAREQGDLALPYELVRGRIRRIDAKQDYAMHPAGGIVTTARDLRRWLAAVVSTGRVDGRQVLPREAVEAALEPRVSLETEYHVYARFAYTLGWYHSRSKGRLNVHHFGGFSGFRTHVSFLPEHGYGVAVLSNRGDGAGRLPHYIAEFIYDYLLDGPVAVSEHEALIAAYATRIRELASRQRQSTKRQGEPCRRSPGPRQVKDGGRGAKAGEYHHPGFPPLIIAATARLGGNIDRLEFDLVGKGDEAYVVCYRNAIGRERDTLAFRVEDSGRVAGLVWRIDEWQDFVFARVD